MIKQRRNNVGALVVTLWTSHDALLVLVLLPLLGRVALGA